MFEDIKIDNQSVFDSTEAQLGEDSLWDDFADSLARSTGGIIAGTIKGSKDLLGKAIKYNPGYIITSKLMGTDTPVQNVDKFMDYIYKPTGKVLDELAWAEKGFQLEKMQDPTDTFGEFAAEAIGGSAPYILGTVLSGGAAAVASAPAWVGSALFGFTVMGQDAYDTAKEQGATDAEAEAERFIIGGINALIETMQLGSLIKGAKGSGATVKGLVNAARTKAWGKVFENGGKLTWDVVRTALEEAGEEALQGTASEGIPALLRDQEIPGGWVGFLSRRSMEALGGGIVGGAMAGAGKFMPSFQKGRVLVDLEQDKVLGKRAKSEVGVEEAVESLTKAGIRDKRQFEIIDEARKLRADIDEGFITEEEAEQHIKEAGLEGLTPDEVKIKGVNLRNSANEAVYKFYQGANGLTVAHEISEDYFREIYGEEANTEEINQLRKDYEEKTGIVFKGNNREWLSINAAELAINGEIPGMPLDQAPTIFQRFKDFITRLFAGSMKVKSDLRSGNISERMKQVLAEPFTGQQIEGETRGPSYELGPAEQKMISAHTPVTSLKEAPYGYILSDGTAVPVGFEQHGPAAEQAGTTMGQIFKDGGIRFTSYKGGQLAIEGKRVPNESQLNQIRNWLAAQLKENGEVFLTTDIPGAQSPGPITTGRELSQAITSLSQATETARSYELAPKNQEDQNADEVHAGREASTSNEADESVEDALSGEFTRTEVNEKVDRAKIGIETLTERIEKQIPPAQKKFEAETSDVRREINKEVYKIASTENGEESAIKIKIAMAKQAERPFFEAFSQETLPQDQRDAIIDQVNKALTDKKISAFEAARAQDFMRDLFNGTMPPKNKNTINALEIVFGKPFAKLVKSKMYSIKGWKQALNSWLNLPRALMAGGELSAFLRQGVIASFAHPIIWGREVRTSFSGLFNADTAAKIDMDTKTGKYSLLARNSGLAITEYEGAELNDREEIMQTDLVEKWADLKSPLAKYTGFKALGTWFRNTQRAYVLFTNGLRMRLFQHYVQEWSGTEKTTEDYKQLAQFLNAVTGRGDIKALEKIAPTLNALFFSPRLLAGRVQSVSMLFEPRTGSAVRKIVAKDLAKFAIESMTLLAVLAMFGFDVEEDPRSGDFGKVKIGETRYDFLGGYAPLIRTTARIATGKTKSSVTGNIKQTDRRGEIERFLRAKLSPIAGTALDVWTGKTFLGEELGLEADLSDEGNAFNYAIRKVVPLFAQDVWDAFQREGVKNGLLSLPTSFMGVGVQTYEDTPYKNVYNTRNTVAREVLGTDWDQLGPDIQGLLRMSYPEIQEAEQEAKAARSNYDFVDDMLKEQLNAGKEVQDTLPADIQKYLKNNSMTIGGLGRTIGKGWKLNDDRYKEYQAQVSLVLNAVLPDLMRSEDFIKLEKQSQQTMFDYIVDALKKEVRNNIVSQANFEDLERLNR